MAKSTSGRVRTIARSAKTGRFVKKSAAQRQPKTTVVETVSRSKKKAVEVVRSSVTGRFVKKSAAKRRPDITKAERVKR